MCYRGKRHDCSTCSNSGHIIQNPKTFSTPLKWRGATVAPRESWPWFLLRAFKAQETNEFRPFQNKTLIRGDAEHPASQWNITTLVWDRGNTSRATDAWAAWWREKRSQEKHCEPAREEESGRSREERGAAATLCFCVSSFQRQSLCVAFKIRLLN